MAFNTTSRAVRFHRWQAHALDLVIAETGDTRSSHVRRAVTDYLERYFPAAMKAGKNEADRRAHREVA